MDNDALDTVGGYWDVLLNLDVDLLVTDVFQSLSKCGYLLSELQGDRSRKGFGIDGGAVAGRTVVSGAEKARE